jgi:hypothetical protein
VNVSDWHFVITSGGLGGILVTALRIIYKMGRLLERFDNHIADSNEIHKVINDRLTWQERRRR